MFCKSFMQSTQLLIDSQLFSVPLEFNRGLVARAPLGGLGASSRVPRRFCQPWFHWPTSRQTQRLAWTCQLQESSANESLHYPWDSADAQCLLERYWQSCSVSSCVIWTCASTHLSWQDSQGTSQAGSCKNTGTAVYFREHCGHCPSTVQVQLVVLLGANKPVLLSAAVLVVLHSR